jgi:2'-5' RNA ligase
MPRMHALELLPDDAGCDVVRRDWQALRDAGLPSQLDHRGTTNSPHVTVLAAPAFSADDEQRAAELAAKLLPVPVRASGIALLGGRRVSVVRVLDVPDELVSAVLELRSQVRDVQHLGWLPHVTLARRLDRADVGRAVAALGHEDAVLTLTSLRRWDPGAGIVTTL